MKTGSQIYSLNPVQVEYVGPVYDTQLSQIWAVVDGYQVNVQFRGDVTPVFANAELAKSYGVLPRRSKIILNQYGVHEDVTNVWYLFNTGLLEIGEVRAAKFRDKIQSQINLLNKENASAKNENIK